MKNKKSLSRKFFNHLLPEKQNSISKIARDSLAIETLGELAVYSAALPYKSFVALTLSKIMSLVNAATGSVFEYDPQTRKASIILWQGMEQDDVEDFSRQAVISESGHKFPGLAANCILKKSPLLVSDPLNDPYLSTDYFRRVIEKYNLSSAVALPLIKESRIYGAMVLFTSGEENKFDEEDVKFLGAVMQPVVSAFEAQRYVSELSAERAKLWKILENLSLGVVFTDGNGIIKNANKTALAMLRMEEGMVIDRSVDEIFLKNLSYPSDNGEDQPPVRFTDITYDNIKEVIYMKTSSVANVMKTTINMPSRWNIKFTRISDDNIAVIFSEVCHGGNRFFAPVVSLVESTLKHIKKPMMDIMNEINLATISGHLNSRQFDSLNKAQNHMGLLWHKISMSEKMLDIISGKVKPRKEIFRPYDTIISALNQINNIITAKNLKLTCRVLPSEDKSFYGDKNIMEEIFKTITGEITTLAPFQTSIVVGMEISDEKLNVEIYSDHPQETRIRDEITARYIKSFMDYLKGEIDFTPPVIPEDNNNGGNNDKPSDERREHHTAQLTKILTLTIPA